MLEVLQMSDRFRGHRPSASMVVSVVALFFALGGAGYAATQLPTNSVGNRQLRNNAVTWQKIARGTIGSARINQGLVQTRVSGTCSGTKGAIGRVLQSGRVSCNSTAPSQFGSAAPGTAVTGTSTPVVRRPLAAGMFLILGEAYPSNTGATPATVTCTLAVPGGASQSRTITVGAGSRAALPVNLAAEVPPGGAAAALSCSQTGSSVTAAGQINAIQTASNG